MPSRREFLQTSSVISLSPLLPSFIGSTAAAVDQSSDQRVLVVIQLDGGNDGINTVVPFGDDGYGRLRAELRLETAKLHKLNEHVGLHPNMPAAKQLFDDGRLAIIQGVGYPNPDRSHFRSMKIWQTARFDETAHDGDGWLGRTLDQPLAHVSGSETAQAIFVGERETPVALWGRRSSATAVSRELDVRLPAELSSKQIDFDQTDRSRSLQQFVTKQVITAYNAADEFQRRQLSASGNDVAFPDTQLASRLKLVSKLLKSGSRVRVFYTIQAGYDTHSTQLFTHSQLLREFADALKAFLDDLASAGLEDRVVVLAFSEFGRRAKENDSRGTDHGTAGPVFLAGRSVMPGLIGKTPDMSDLDNGDLKMNIDFRSVYATVLDQWFGIDPQKVLAGSFERLPLIQT